jgi:hypothetical protein
MSDDESNSSPQFERKRQVDELYDYDDDNNNNNMTTTMNTTFAQKAKNWFVFLQYPWSVWFIISNELCERFSFYGFKTVCFDLLLL